MPKTGDYEVCSAEGPEFKFFHFDDILARHQRPDMLTSEQAMEQAKAVARVERDKVHDLKEPS